MSKISAVLILVVGLIIGAAFSTLEQATAQQEQEQYVVAYTMYDHMGDWAYRDGWTEAEAIAAAAELRNEGWDNTVVFAYTPED